MWTRWRCRRCYHDIPAVFRGKYRQAVATRYEEWSTEFSTLSGEEDSKYKSPGGSKVWRPKIRSFEPGFRPRRRKVKELVEGGQGLL